MIRIRQHFCHLHQFWKKRWNFFSKNPTFQKKPSPDVGIIWEMLLFQSDSTQVCYNLVTENFQCQPSVHLDIFNPRWLNDYPSILKLWIVQYGRQPAIFRSDCFFLQIVRHLLRYYFHTKNASVECKDNSVIKWSHTIW